MTTHHVLRLHGPDCPRCLRPVVSTPPGSGEVLVNGQPACRCPTGQVRS